MYGLVWALRASSLTFEDFIHVREIAIVTAIATFAPGGATRSSFLPLLVEDGFANLFELFLFTGLHEVPIFTMRIDNSRPLSQRFMPFWSRSLHRRRFFHWRGISYLLPRIADCSFLNCRQLCCRRCCGFRFGDLGICIVHRNTFYADCN